ncbi:MAG: DMT family transporter [Parachlamydiales bacterium]
MGAEGAKGKQKRRLKGIGYALLAAWVYATIGLAAKSISGIVSPEVMIWYRATIGFLAFLPLFFYDVHQYGIDHFQPVKPRLLLLRSVTSLLAGYLLFVALKTLPLTNAIVLSYTRPLWIPILVWLFLGKRLERIIWISLAIGFAGVILVLKPGAARLEWGSLVALASGFVGGIASLAIRRLNRVTSANNITFHYFWTSLLFTSIPLIWLWKTPDLNSLLWLIGIGLLAILYQMFLVRAYRYTRASIVGSVLYSMLLFSLLYEWLFFQKTPDLLAWLGILLIVGSAIMAVTLSRQKKEA